MKLTLYYQESAELGSVSELKLGLNLMCYIQEDASRNELSCKLQKISVQMYNTKLIFFHYLLKA